MTHSTTTRTISATALTGCKRTGRSSRIHAPRESGRPRGRAQALGYDRVDLLSESVGTRTAMIYAWRYPQSIHRSVMIGVNPPGHFLWDAKTTDEQLRRYAELCAKDDSCSKRTDDLAVSIRETAADIP